MKILSLSLALIAGATCAETEIRLPHIFGSHMVLQRDLPLPVWGWAPSGVTVKVAFAGQEKTATAGRGGRWSCRLDPLAQSGEGRTLTVSDAAAPKSALTFEDVLVGDVWLCSGQSNMAMGVGSANNAQKEIASAKHPNIRLFKVGSQVAKETKADCQGSWAACSPKSVGSFSAAGYFFGRHLHQETGVPIGLIHSAWGGTRIEAWTAAGTLAKHPHGQKVAKRQAEQDKNYDAEALQARYKKALARHEQQLAAWKETRKGKPPRKPRPPTGSYNQNSPSALYNGMIAPLIPFGLKGATWYQGERNAKGGTAYIYRDLMAGLIANWRADWNQPGKAKAFPFFLVQLPNYRGQPGTEDWPVIRESFAAAAAKVPNAGMAVTIDIGDVKDIHPKNKQDVGKRLALAALNSVYGKPNSAPGPLLNGSKAYGKTFVLKFKNCPGGLQVKGDAAVGFTIAGSDRKFVEAQAKVAGDTVTVWSDAVPEPEAVRYAWANDPQVSLYNAEGLPASPFRTDTWPVNISE